MKNTSSNPLFQTQAFGALITMFSLNGLYVSTYLIGIFKPIRYALLLAIALYILNLLIVLSQSKKIRKNEFVAFLLHVFLLIYGLLLSSRSGGLFLIDPRDYLFLILSLILTLFAFNENNCTKANIVSPPCKHISPSRNLKLKSLFKLNFNLILPLIFFLSPFILLATDNLIFTPIPRIVFDLDEVTRYSQNTTAFFAISSIVFTFLTLSARTYAVRLAFIVIAFVMTAISALGGARGDFLVGLIVVFVMILRKNSLRNYFALITIFLPFAFLLLPNIINSLGELLIVKRLSVFVDGTNFGKRDVLLQQTLNLLADQDECLLTGCGFNYFQIYYGYEFGMNPHNIFAETLLTYGIFLGGTLVLLAILGAVYGFFYYHHRTFLYWIFLYLLGLSLKSGSLISYSSISVLVFFAYLGLVAMRQIAAKFLSSNIVLENDRTRQHVETVK